MNQEQLQKGLRELKPAQQMDYSERVNAAMKSTNYPDMGRVPERLFDWLPMAMSHETTQNLQCSWDIIKALIGISVDRPKSISMLHMGYICNCIESKSMSQMGYTVENYIYMMDQVKAIADKWNDICHLLKVEAYKAVRLNKTILLPSTPKLVSKPN